MVSPVSGFNPEKAIFLEAIEIEDAAERAAFLDRRCGRDSSLRSNVEALLACHLSDDFLQSAADTDLVQTARDSIAQSQLDGTLQVGEIVDRRFRLVEWLGEGGCGSVYRAEQLFPIRREVAMKVVKLGMNSETVLSRFEAEKQALARMDHAGIARVYDGGTTESGRPYFAMELVQGVRITTYANRHQLSLQGRIELLIEVCHAIQHAHQKGIIHRDIKPSNILVSESDGRRQVKVIDFGIAKALDQSLTGEPSSTAIHLFVGTPAYTSPEQAAMSGESIDTRSDVYSLGILLYELIAGVPPFEPGRFSNTTLDAMRQIICEELPQRPSLVKPSSPDEVPLPADLDWIAMKCLEKEPDRRYATVDELAKDLERHLEGEAVLAHPPSAMYRFQRFVRRNRIVVSTAALVLLTLIVATGVSTWMAARAIRAEREQGRLLDMAEARRIEALRQSYISDMNLVPMALAANNRGRARELLHRHIPSIPTETDSSSPDFRQWEWRYFTHQTRSAAALELPPHAHRVRSVAFDATGDWIGSVDERDEFRLWSRDSGQTVPRMARAEVTGFAFSPEGQFLATTERDRGRRTRVAVWELKSGQVYRETTVSASIAAVSFNADGSELVLVDRQRQVHRWLWQDNVHSELSSETGESNGGRGRGRLRGWMMRFSPDGRWLAVVGRGDVSIYDTVTGDFHGRVQTSVDSIASLAFSPDNTLLGVGPSFLESDSDVRVFDLNSLTQVGTLVGHSSWVSGVAFSPDGERVITTAADQTVRIWDRATWHPIKVLRGHAAEVNCVGLSNSGEWAVSGGKDGSLLVWELERARNSLPVETLPPAVRDIVFLGRGTPFLSLNHDGSVAAWNATNLEPQSGFQLVSRLNGEYSELISSSDGSYVAAKSRDGRVIVVDTQNLTEREFESPGRSQLIGFHGRDGDLLQMDAGGQLQLCHLESGSSRAVGTLPPRSRPVVSPTHAVAAYSNRRGEICLQDWLSDSLSVLPKEDDWFAGGLMFSADGTRLAAAMIDGSIRLWDVATGLAMATIHGHLLGVHAVAFSPDGKRLASASAKHEAVKLWDLETYREVGTLGGEGAWFDRLQFSPDGVLLVAINRAGKAHIWRAPKDPANPDQSGILLASPEPLVVVSVPDDGGLPLTP